MKDEPFRTSFSCVFVASGVASKYLETVTNYFVLVDLVSGFKERLFVATISVVIKDRSHPSILHCNDSSAGSHL